MDEFIVHNTRKTVRGPYQASSSRASFNHKHGQGYLNTSATDLMGVKRLSYVVLLQKGKNWYIAKAEDEGFILNNRTKNDTYGLKFFARHEIRGMLESKGIKENAPHFLLQETDKQYKGNTIFELLYIKL